MPAIKQRPPPPPRGHAPRLRASVRRNLSQFELDDVDMEDAPGNIEDVLDGRGRGRPRGRPRGGRARGTPARGRPRGRSPERRSRKRRITMKPMMELVL